MLIKISLSPKLWAKNIDEFNDFASFVMANFNMPNIRVSLLFNGVENKTSIDNIDPETADHLLQYIDELHDRWKT